VQAPQKGGPANALNRVNNIRRSKCLEEMEEARMVRGPEQEEARAAAGLTVEREIRDGVRARAEVRVRARAEVRALDGARAREEARALDGVRVRAVAADNFHVKI